MLNPPVLANPANARVAPRDSLRSLLRAYGRFASLIAEQLEALDRQDYPRLHQLALDRESVQREIDLLAGDARDDGIEGIPERSAEVDQLLASALDEVHRRASDDEALRHHLQRLREGVLGAARGVILRRAERVTGRYESDEQPAETVHRLDVRF
jgi:hypothetical protein